MPPNAADSIRILAVKSPALKSFCRDKIRGYTMRSRSFEDGASNSSRSLACETQWAKLLCSTAYGGTDKQGAQRSSAKYRWIPRQQRLCCVLRVRSKAAFKLYEAKGQG